MTDARIEIAARNNAQFCDAVCRAHGHAGGFAPELWSSPEHELRYYPNLITLSPAPEPALQAIDGLAGRKLDGSFSVKDSFGTLDLSARGFRCLLRAQWLWRAPPNHGVAPALRGGATITRVPIASNGWRRIETADELGAWERAWSGSSDPLDRITFPPSLLHERDVAFLQLEDGSDIAAGLIANRSSDAVGVSNLFLHDGAPEVFLGALATIETLYPDLPLVGYEPIEALDQARTLGFEVLGPLRIWVGAAR